MKANFSSAFLFSIAVVQKDTYGCRPDLHVSLRLLSVFIRTFCLVGPPEMGVVCRSFVYRAAQITTRETFIGFRINAVAVVGTLSGIFGGDHPA